METTDQRALLKSPKHDVLKQHLFKKRKKTFIFIIISIILLFIAAILIFIVFDVFHVFDSSKASFTPEMIGLWPTYGGSLQNKQSPPDTTNILINRNNIKNLQIQCIYESPNGIGTSAYPAIDNENNAYFSDYSGYVTSINLDSCAVNWRSHIGSLLGYDNKTKVNTYQSLTLFQDSQGTKGVLFGAPQGRKDYYPFLSTYPKMAGCYAIALHLNNGSLWWKLQIGEDNNPYDFQCGTHGFYVDGKFAFGGYTQSSSYNLQNGSKFLGRFIKIDLEKHNIVNIWYPFHKNLTDQLDEYNKSYNGIGIYNFPSIMDDFVTFGTSNLQRTPQIIDDCLTFGQTPNITTGDDRFNQYLLLNNSHYIDLCGNDQSDNRFWRCLKKDMFTVSLIILNKTDFSLIKGIPLQGLDVYYGEICAVNPDASPFCPSAGNFGTNSDVAAVATYRNKEDGKLYVVASQKSARLMVFELESGKLIFTKKYGPGSNHGQFSMAVDEENMIGITSINGAGLFQIPSRYKLANNLTVCNDTGSIHAFDLRTGNTIWQVINPYGTINESICYNDTIWDRYIDYTLRASCDYGSFLPPSMTAYNNVIIPPKSNDTFIPLHAKARARFRAPVTIVNNLVFIPSSTGDIWVHDVRNGTFIHHFTCPNTDTLNGTNQLNRPGIKGGISVVNDRVVFYCGLYMPIGVEHEIVNGNLLVSMKLDNLFK